MTRLHQRVARNNGTRLERKRQTGHPETPDMNRGIERTDTDRRKLPPDKRKQVHSGDLCPVNLQTQPLIAASKFDGVMIFSRTEFPRHGNGNHLRSGRRRFTFQNLIHSVQISGCLCTIPLRKTVPLLHRRPAGVDADIQSALRPARGKFHNDPDILPDVGIGEPEPLTAFYP